VHFYFNKYRQYSLWFLCISLIFTGFPSLAQAHAYSASFTNFIMDSEKSELIFSIDTLSIIELIPDIDKNKNYDVEKSEMKKASEELEELIHDHLALDQNNRQQEPTLEQIKLEKKDDKNYLSFYLRFPVFAPGDTISFNDGLYMGDPNTNYVNLISFEYPGATGQAVLQGKERTWTVLLTEAQEEQTTDGSQTAQPEAGQTPDDSSTQPETVQQSASSSWLAFFKLGMLHILTGYDHLLFLFALLLRKQTFKQYAAVVTSFTVAHSITISLAVLGLVTLPSRFVEAIIAFSICYVALENVFRKELKNRWGITFLFGLVHGLGFASILKEMNILKSDLAVALFNFNIGIEAVQLAIVLVLLPLLTYTFKLKISDKIIRYGSYGIFVLGAIWLVQRLFM
jgi:hydrogenase/urease accessory protein HupE